MSGICSFHSHDYMPVHIVPVIASFDTDGHIVPIYVRLWGKSYKIQSHWENSRFVGQLEFHCKITENNIEKPLILTFFKEENVWAIPQTGTKVCFAHPHS